MKEKELVSAFNRAMKNYIWFPYHVKDVQHTGYRVVDIISCIDGLYVGIEFKIKRKSSVLKQLTSNEEKSIIDIINNKGKVLIIWAEITELTPSTEKFNFYVSTLMLNKTSGEINLEYCYKCKNVKEIPIAIDRLLGVNCNVEV